MRAFARCTFTRARRLFTQLFARRGCASVLLFARIRALRYSILARARTNLPPKPPAQAGDPLPPSPAHARTRVPTHPRPPDAHHRPRPPTHAPSRSANPNHSHHPFTRLRSPYASISPSSIYSLRTAPHFNLHPIHTSIPASASPVPPHHLTNHRQKPSTCLHPPPVPNNPKLKHIPIPCPRRPPVPCPSSSHVPTHPSINPHRSPCAFYVPTSSTSNTGAVRTPRRAHGSMTCT